MINLDEAERCKDCARSYRVDNPMFVGRWQLNCPYHFGVTYAVARSVDTGKLCNRWKPKGSNQ